MPQLEGDLERLERLVLALENAASKADKEKIEVVRLALWEVLKEELDLAKTQDP